MCRRRGLNLLACLLVELDIGAFVKRWKADGHLSAVMKDSGAVRARQVLERKAQEHKVSFLA